MQDLCQDRLNRGSILRKLIARCLEEFPEADARGNFEGARHAKAIPLPFMLGTKGAMFAKMVVEVKNGHNYVITFYPLDPEVLSQADVAV